MAVITRVYESYAEARRALDAVNALGLSGVEGSLLGNESVSEFREVDRRDPVTGEVIARSDARYDDPAYVDEPASATATGAGVGAALGGGAGLLAGLGMLAIPGLGPIVAAGWLAATAVGAAGGALAGGAIGALADLGLSDEEAPVFSEAIRRGGVGVSVRFTEEHRYAVESALAQVPTSSYDDLRGRYETEGWRADETEAERIERLRREDPYEPPRPML